MPSEWWQARLTDAVTLQRGFDLPTPQRRRGKVPILGSFGVTGWHSEARVTGPGVTIGRSGASIGVASYTDKDFWPLNTTLYVKDFKGNDPRWVYWLLRTIDFSAYNSGSAQPSLNRNLLTTIPVQLPPVPEQSRIAGVLGALDGLIDANRSVADKCAELAVELAARSADRVVLDEIAIMARPELFSPSGRVDHYSIPAFDQARLPERVDGAAIKSGKQKLTDPTVLVSRLNPQTQRVWMAYPSGVAAGASTEFVPLHARGQITIEEVWAVCAADAFGGQMRAHATGTTGSHQRVNKAAIPTLLVPDVRALDDNKRALIVSLVREAHASLTAAAEVASARDELLPLLLSGQVRADEVAG